MAVAAGPDAVEDGLVLCLDAGNSRSYPGSGTAWNDLTATSNGTLTNGPTFVTDNGGAIKFDGVNDFVTVPHSTSFVATNDFTMECVFYWNGSTAAANGIFGKRVGSPVQQLQFWNANSTVTAAGDFINIFVDGGAGTRNTGWQMPSAGIYHAQATMSSTALRLTVNGIFRSENTTAMSATYSTNSPFIVGNANGLSSFFPDKVWLCRYYTRTLTGAELQQNFNATRARFNL